MPWVRDWDGICNVYKKWDEAVATWTIEDLNPEDDQIAMDLMIEHMLEEALFCNRLAIKSDPVSVTDARKFWEDILSLRTSLGCYRHYAGSKELAGLNACLVKSLDDPPFDISQIQGEKCKIIVGGLGYMNNMVDVFQELGVTRVLSAVGLLVSPKYRGMKLGQKILDAREPLCRILGVSATATTFSGVASQKSASRCGFRTVSEVTLSQLADAGFHFPGDQTTIVKLMVKNYN